MAKNVQLFGEPEREPGQTEQIEQEQDRIAQERSERERQQRSGSDGKRYRATTARGLSYKQQHYAPGALLPEDMEQNSLESAKKRGLVEEVTGEIQERDQPVDRRALNRTVPRGRWDLKPERLQNKSLEQLNVMVRERDASIEPFETREEAIAQLSLDTPREKDQMAKRDHDPAQLRGKNLQELNQMVKEADPNQPVFQDQQKAIQWLSAEHTKRAPGERGEGQG